MSNDICQCSHPEGCHRPKWPEGYSYVPIGTILPRPCTASVISDSDVNRTISYMHPCFCSDFTPAASNKKAVGAPPDWPHGYLECGCRNDGKGNHVR